MDRVTEMFWFRLIMLCTWSSAFAYLIYKVHEALSSQLLSFVDKFVA